MNIEKISQEALERIKQITTLPKTGILAGGSLANIMWEIVSGNKAVINDVDIFEFKEKTSKEEYHKLRKYQLPKKNFYEVKDVKYIETYSGLTFRSDVDKFYYIISTQQDGIINKIDIGGTDNDVQTVLDSFDINCTQVAYCLESEKFYYTDDFINFLKTGKLYVVNFMSPSHSAIRIAKKAKELNVELDEYELKLCAYVNHKNFIGVNRRYFTMKYANMFRENANILKKYFMIQKDDSMKNFIFKNELERNENMIFRMSSSDEFNPDLDYNEFNGLNCTTCEEFESYVRNFRHIEKGLYTKLRHVIDRKDYFDMNASKEDIELLHDIIQTAPQTIPNLRGYKLSEQINYVNRLISRYEGEKKYVAICVLEHPNFKLDKIDQYTNEELLLFQLNMRKRLIDTKSKKNHMIFKEPKPNKVEKVESPDDFWDF